MIFSTALISVFLIQLVTGLIVIYHFPNLLHPFYVFGGTLVLTSWVSFMITAAIYRKPYVIFLSISSLITLAIVTYSFLLLYGWDYILEPKGFIFVGTLRTYLLFPLTISVASAMLLEFIYRFKEP